MERIDDSRLVKVIMEKMQDRGSVSWQAFSECDQLLRKYSLLCNGLHNYSCYMYLLGNFHHFKHFKSFIQSIYGDGCLPSEEEESEGSTSSVS